MSKTKAFVTGVTGQLGAYLAKFLLEKDIEVFGLVRRSSANGNLVRLEELGILDKINVLNGDVTDIGTLIDAVRISEPDYIYNLSAFSHVKDSFAAPKLVAEVDYIGTINLLEALRITGFERFVKLAHMSTSELFGDTKPPQNELSRFNPQSPYACAKLASYHLVRNYREANRLFYCNAITFNFESPLRNEDFVTKKICKQMAEIRLGKRDRIYLGNLKAKRDWQSVHDVIDGLWLMLNHAVADDFVFASGQAKTVYDLYAYVCKKLELDPLKYLYSDDSLIRPNEVDYLLGDAEKARKHLKWAPKYSFERLIDEMVEYEIAKLRG
jgi:GDPmannose 4,6-dehydratase